MTWVPSVMPRRSSSHQAGDERAVSSAGVTRRLVDLCALCSALSLPLVGCEKSSLESAETRVQVGVFFGGQVQQLEEVRYSALEPPLLGFRLTRSRKDQSTRNGSSSEATVSKEIRFQLVVPGPAGRRVTKIGEVHWAADAASLDQVFDLPEHARHGIWNVRIVQDDFILADRAIHVTPP